MDLVDESHPHAAKRGAADLHSHGEQDGARQWECRELTDGDQLRDGLLGALLQRHDRDAHRRPGRRLHLFRLERCVYWEGHLHGESHCRHNGYRLLQETVPCSEVR